MMRIVLIRRSVWTGFIAMGLMAIVILVVLSPFALAGIGHFGNDWIRFSDIGQTYGAVSALVSALALGGILVSLLYQARDSRNSYEQMTRTFQFELIKLELEDPSLMAAMGAPWGNEMPSDRKSLREFLYVQMWVSFLSGNYATGELSASTVRQFAALELFRGKAGRIYWAAVGKRQLANSKGHYNEFFRLLDAEYKSVISSGVPEAGPIDDDTVAASPGFISKMYTDYFGQVAGVVLTVIIGVLAKRLWRCKNATAG
jgi:hypothetical protein